MIDALSLKDMHFLHHLAGLTDQPVSDYLVLRVNGSKDAFKDFNTAFRFDGMICAIVRSGSVTVSLNMEEHTLRQNEFCIVGSNSTVRFDSGTISSLDAYLLFIGAEFARTLNFEVTVLNTLPIATKATSVFTFSPADVRQIIGYFSLLDMNLRRNAPASGEALVNGISRSLLTSTVYQMMLTGMRSKQAAETFDSGSGTLSRRMLYTREFVRLVRKHYREEHSVGFYARELCISPKYLSILVKETSGKSAAEIIDDHLLMEAKNLLRFSGKNIQQVAYALNFPNQSSFGKYFKNLTGLSPSQFVNS